MKYGLTLSRRFIQAGILTVLAFLPLLGLFRIDVAHGRFVLFGYQIWWSDFFVVYPFWIMAITLMATLYTVFGMVFCGWGCPQNTLSEFADKLIKKWVGKKASAGVGNLEGEMVSSPANRMKNWAAVVGVFLALSLLLGFVGSAYFLPPGTSWNLSLLPGWVWLVTFMIAAIVFLDLILIRHFWCSYVCPYGLYQYLFHHPRTMRVAFDEARQSDCIGCNRCTDSCFMGVEPRLVKEFTRCINCGDCIVACDEVAAKKRFLPLLSFTFRRDEGSRGEIGGSIAGRVFWPAAIFGTAACLFVYGVATYQPVHLRVSPTSVSAAGPFDAGGRAGSQAGDYVVEVFNKSPRTREWTLEVSGLPEGAAVFSHNAVTLPGGSSGVVRLQILEAHPDLRPGVPYPFEVTVREGGAAEPVLSEHSVFYNLSHPG